MEKFIAEYDPLAALDAEYAAVVAQTRASSKAPASGSLDASNQVENDQVEPAQSDEEDDEDSLGEEQYALLPTSPAGSGGGFSDEDGEEEDEERRDEAPKTQPEAQSLPPPMDAATKQTIMASMQSMRLQPPPWASAAAIGDDELIELVQKRLQLRAGAEVARTEG